MSLPLVQAKSCKLLTKGLLEEEKSLLAIYNKKPSSLRLLVSFNLCHHCLSWPFEKKTIALHSKFEHLNLKPEYSRKDHRAEKNHVLLNGLLYYTLLLKNIGSKEKQTIQK